MKGIYIATSHLLVGGWWLVSLVYVYKRDSGDTSVNAADATARAFYKPHAPVNVAAGAREERLK